MCSGQSSLVLSTTQITGSGCASVRAVARSVSPKESDLRPQTCRRSNRSERRLCALFATGCRTSASPALNVLRSLAQDGLGRTISGSASASRPAVARSAPSAMNVLHAPSSEPPDRTDRSFCITKRCGAVGWTTTEIGHSSAHARVREYDASVLRLLTDPVPGSMTPRRRPVTRSNAQAGSTSACGRYGSITMCGGWAEARGPVPGPLVAITFTSSSRTAAMATPRTGLSSLNTAPG